ncbi:MAG: hypothetical protein ACOCQR_00390 [bacterium]
MNKIFYLLVLLVLMFPLTSYASIHGDVNYSYNTMQKEQFTNFHLYQVLMDNKLQIGSRYIVNAYEEKKDYYSDDVNESSFVNNTEDKFFYDLAAREYALTYYSFYANYKVTDKIEIRLNEWHDHWFAQKNGAWLKDNKDISLGAKYIFENHGYVSLDYNTSTGNTVGQIRLYQDLFNKRLRIGGHMTTDVNNFVLKDGYMPAGVPYAQYYEMFIEYKLSDRTMLHFNQWCNHWLDQGPKRNSQDNIDITVGITYSF